MRELALVFSIGLSVASIAHAQDTRPNIVILLADDMGVGDLGVYGQTQLHTPHIDALAHEGVIARRAYAAAPVCAPSRCSLLTGLHAGHCSVDHNDEPNVPLGLSDPTIAEVLAREGYRTGIVGKWGLGGETDHGDPFTLASLPSRFGFEHSLVVLDQERAQDHFPDRVWSGDAWRAIAENADGARGRWDADVFADDALVFVDDGDARPFFLYFASTLPHRGMDVPSLGGDPSWPDAERAYATMVERFDADVGRIVEHLDRLHRDTIVIVASDNGPVDVDGHSARFFDSTAGLRGQKRELYEGGLRVPLIVRWRAHLEAREVTTPVALYDLFPTLAAMIDVDAPAAVDGVSIEAWLRGERSDAAHASMFFAVSEANGGIALREGPLALVSWRDRPSELYDVEADPPEAHDLAASRAEDVARLSREASEANDGLVRRSWPILQLVGDGVLLPAVDPRPFSVVLALAPTSAIDAISIESHGEAPDLVVTAHGGHADEGAIVLASGDYLTVASAPALSFGDASFTLQARVRLDHVAADATTRGSRRYLALSKPTGMPDELLDWGVLVQAGDLAPGRTGHELAIVFADPEIGGHGTWTIATHELAITDDAWHAIVVRFDAEHRHASFRLDDRTEEIDVTDLGHFRSDGPLVIGAHHDLHGTFDGFLDGALEGLRLSRGAMPDEWLDRQTREPTHDLELALGDIPLGSEDVVRTLWVANVGASPVMAMDVDEESSVSDARVEVTLAPARTVLDRIPITVRVHPTSAGAFSATVAIAATVSHYGIRVRGPIGFTVSGEVIAPPASRPAVPEWWIFVAAGFLALGARLAFRPRPAKG